jgi:hypothetical protein
VNEDTAYSTPCNPVKIVANITVYNKPYKALLLFPFIKKWCAYVTVNPEESKITVFINGSSKGSIASIPIGGHIAPNSTAGERALWKNVQNIAKKNKASDTINKPTPRFSPLWTARVWCPIYVPSAITSLHQNDIDNINAVKLSIKLYSA